jgi:hypothetical protein|tara:strand:+ start:1659 stop:1868 length:210 start_codon:yes stop_codon:yes gene_type:complete
MIRNIWKIDPGITGLGTLSRVHKMRKKRQKLKIRNPIAVALQKRHGGGVKPHKNKKKYTRKLKHKTLDF